MLSPLHELQGCRFVRPEVTSRKLMNIESLCLICVGFVAWTRNGEAPVGCVQVSKTVIGLSARPGPLRERIAAPKTAENCGARTSLEGCNARCLSPLPLWRLRLGEASLGKVSEATNQMSHRPSAEPTAAGECWSGRVQECRTEAGQCRKGGAAGAVRYLNRAEGSYKWRHLEGLDEQRGSV